MFTSFDRMLDELREHKEIFNSVKARDSSRAREVMSEHERNVLEYLRNRVFPILLQRSCYGLRFWILRLRVIINVSRCAELRTMYTRAW